MIAHRVEVERENHNPTISIPILAIYPHPGHPAGSLMEMTVKISRRMKVTEAVMMIPIRGPVKQRIQVTWNQERQKPVLSQSKIHCHVSPI